jgi:hypothetical protein
MISKEQLVELLQEYQSGKDQHLAGANACVGAIEVINRLIQIDDDKETEDN